MISEKKSIALVLLICSLTLGLIWSGLVAPTKSSIDFCTWSVSSGVAEQIGRELTPGETEQVRDTCKVWWKAYAKGTPYYQQELHLGR